MTDDTQCAQTPLLDLLRGVPLDARMTYEVNPTHHHMIPVGRLCADAAAELEQFRDALSEIRDSDAAPGWCREVAREALKSKQR